MAITATEFKDYFDRGQFSYGDNVPDIRDKDIDAAIVEAESVYNRGIYPDDSTADLALMYLTAHFLLSDTDAGASGGQSTFNQTSRSADGISESVEVPQWLKDGPFSIYATTYYGVKYALLTDPYMGGAVFTVKGSTRP